MAAEAEPAAAQATKRYRPAPAKTFQCKGYGECRMVFSRSEHLARHIRKHTGERPFTCHCSKQFSRLDNLRQHAQTVHADKQDQNERMMRDLTSLHASMAAANKIGGSGRGGRRAAANPAPNPVPQQLPPSPHSDPGTNAVRANRTASPMDMVKQEDPISYDSSDLYHTSHWPSHPHPDLDASPKFFAQPLSFSSGSRPSTSERLPPLSAVVSAAQQQPMPIYQQQALPAHLRPRPSTANRPGSSSETATSFYPNPALLSTTTATSNGKAMYPTQYTRSYANHSPNGPGFDPSSSSDSGAPAESSPFYFAPPAPPASSTSTTTSTSSPSTHTTSSTTPPLPNPRKRSFAGPDGPLRSYDELAGYSNGSMPSLAPGPGLDYDYGSESRPQSRRLTVMELCNDGTAPSAEFSAPPPASAPPINAVGVAYPQHAPPPRPHSTFSVSSATSHQSASPPMGHLQSSYGHHHHQQQQQQFYGHPQHHPQQQQHQHHQQQQHQPHHQQQSQYGMSLHPSHHPYAHHTHSPLPTPTSASLPPNSAAAAASYYNASPRSATFSPRVPGGQGQGQGGHMAHQQAQAFQALQAQQASYGGGYGGVGVGAGGYEYGYAA
ncbi:hypothetical protein H0H87_000249 [Tephrocybe sp. NHM501043]|nr:hypothetical protein H0H87_000249 [Tephrocybe sp. NHM501043]